MATYSTSDARLLALADAASEAESETHLRQEDRAPPVADAAAELREMMREMAETFSRQMTALNKRMDDIEQDPRSKTNQPISRTSRGGVSDHQPPRLWADRPLDEPIPQDPPTWPDEEDDLETESRAETDLPDLPAGDDDTEGCPLHKVSPTTETLLKEAFSKPVANASRRRWRKTFGMPASDMTKCPKLDNTLRPQLPKDAKDGDRGLSRIQTLVLDAVGPLTRVLELHQAGRLTTDIAVDATSQALKFLGNTHAQISTERRKKIAGHLNKDLRPLVEEPERFSSAAPYLFGRDFEKEAKDHIDSVRSLRKLSAPSGAPRQNQFFRPGRPHYAARGGGQFPGSSRGGGRGRYRPYSSRENRRPKGENPPGRQ